MLISYINVIYIYMSTSCSDFPPVLMNPFYVEILRGSPSPAIHHAALDGSPTCTLRDLSALVGKLLRSLSAWSQNDSPQSVFDIFCNAWCQWCLTLMVMKITPKWTQELLTPYLLYLPLPPDIQQRPASDARQCDLFSSQKSCKAFCHWCPRLSRPGSGSMPWFNLRIPVDSRGFPATWEQF